MRKQRGLSLTVLLIISFFVIATALLGFKLFPAYAEFFTIEKALKEIVRNPESRGSVREIQTAFDRRATIDNIRAVGGKDLEITRSGDKLAIAASWSVKIPLMYNISACIDFETRAE